jgi:hypothetical protein
LFILNNLKFFRTATLSFTKHLWTLTAIEKHTRNFLGVWEVALQGLVICSLSSRAPFTLGAVDFSILIHNWWFLVSDECTGGVQVLFGHQNQQNPPLGSDLPKPFQPLWLVWFIEILGEYNIHGCSIELWEIVQILPTNESNGLHPCKKWALPTVHYWLCLKFDGFVKWLCLRDRFSENRNTLLRFRNQRFSNAGFQRPRNWLDTRLFQCKLWGNWRGAVPKSLSYQHIVIKTPRTLILVFS